VRDTIQVVEAAEKILNYSDRLDADPNWALTQGSLFFMEKGDVQATLRGITRRLDELRIPYVIVGGMALYRHGFRRFTEDVDLLVTRDGLKAVHEALDGLGYLHVFKGSKKLRDTTTGVQIDFLISGDYPGDGKPKPVAFPQPDDWVVVIEGLRVLALPRLVELKLASGMTGGVNRMKDFTDVVELIKALNLPADFSKQLNEYVRPKFDELWQGVKDSPEFES